MRGETNHQESLAFRCGEYVKIAVSRRGLSPAFELAVLCVSSERYGALRQGNWELSVMSQRLLGIALVGLALMGLAWRLGARDRPTASAQQQDVLLLQAQAPPPTPAPTVAVAYPPTFRRDYLGQCVGDRPELRPICECTYRRITATYTYQQYLIFTNRLQTEGRIPLEIAQINQLCVIEVGQGS